METDISAYTVGNKLERSRYYMGGLWTFLATGKDTNGQFALIECNQRRGIEPPRHVHSKEDEVNYLLEGEMEFVVGETEHTLRAGDFIFLPKHIPHHFRIQSDTVKYLLQITPAGLEEMFLELSRPAERLELPPRPTGPPSPEIVAKIKRLQQQYGIIGMDLRELKTS